MQKCFHPGWNTHIGANKIFLKKSGGRMIHLLKPKEISIEGIKFLGGSRCGVCNRPTQVLMSQVSPGCREWLLKRGVAIAVGEPPRCCWSLQLRNTLLRLSVISPMSYERVLRGLYLCRARDVRVCPRAFTTWNRHYYVLAYAVCNYNFRGLLLSSAYFFLLLLFFSLFFHSFFSRYNCGFRGLNSLGFYARNATVEAKLRSIIYSWNRGEVGRRFETFALPVSVRISTLISNRTWS